MTDDRSTYRQTTISGYDALAAQADALREGPWGDSDYQRYYVWPAVKPLLPDLTDARVLDAGCGIGSYVGEFLERGASVVGVDASEAAISTARSRFGDRAEFGVADLTDPLDFADDSFDLVFCNLVLDHVRDWAPVFDEFRRVLAHDGALVFTTIHPVGRYRRHRDELTRYYDVEAYVSPWGETDAEIASYHRPIAAVLNPLVGSGFDLDVFREATPEDAYEECQPDRYERAMERPDLLCVRAE